MGGPVEERSNLPLGLDSKFTYLEFVALWYLPFSSTLVDKRTFLNLIVLLFRSQSQLLQERWACHAASQMDAT